MIPFVRARQAANELRERLFPGRAGDAFLSNGLVAAATEAEDLLVDPLNPEDISLGGADALLVRQLRQILVRNDVSGAEQAFLVSHEIGHWLLHLEEHEGCHKVVEASFSPDKSETFGAQKVDAYGARERAELQANVFAREFLLPRGSARILFLNGKKARAIAKQLDLPLELVRQQLLDGLLLPSRNTEEEAPEQSITPTKQQQDAAASEAKVSLIVAGPGTGKTTTLLLRIQYLLALGVPASEILVLTFSNRAARELVDRLKLLGISNCHEIWIGTFHAFGLEFLRKNHEQFGLEPNFGVADKLAQITLIEPHIHDVALKAFSPIGDPLDWLADVIKTIQRAKDELVGPAEFYAAVRSEKASTDQKLQAKRKDVAALYVRYEIEKKRGGRLADLGDLVMLPALALQNDRAKFEASVGRFKHILVDEYQDVNRASAELIKALTKNAISLWVVGDPRQAIYRFRGASMRNIVRFGNDFPNYVEFKLSENRRSFEEVVRLFEHTGRHDHPLQLDLPLHDVTAVRGSGGVRPQRVICPDIASVNAELVSSAQALAATGVAYRNQVALASTHKTCSAAAEALNQAGIPALYLGDIFQREEIKNLLTILHSFVDRSGSGFVRLGKLSDLKLPEADLRILLPWLQTNRPNPLLWLSKPPEGLSSDGARAIDYWRKIFSGLKSSDSPWDVVCEILLDRTDLLSLKKESGLTAALSFRVKPKSLLGLRDHIVHGGLHGGVLERSIAALGRHHAFLALVALDRMIVELCIALGDTRTPVSLVAELRRAGDTGGMAHAATCVVGGLALVRVRGVGRRDQGVHHRVGRDHSQLTDRLDALGHGLGVRGRDLGLLGLGADDVGKDEQYDRQGNEGAEQAGEVLPEVTISHGLPS